MIIDMEKISEKKRFSIVARAKSFTHAFRGIGILIKSTHNFWVHIFFAVIVILLSFILNISHIEWILIVFTIGFVMVSEAFNTAIEIDMDLTSPNYHPYARDTKDVAAGAVLISAITSIIIGLIIFLPKILALYF
jgi:diacylglycerol kinase (ATP)